MYKKRIVDDYLNKITKVFNAVNIIGPKGCGKTTTAKERCKTIIEFQDEEKRENYILISNLSPSQFLQNAKPILFDEWQDAPKIWGTIRKDCDDHPYDVGSYYLTGSSSKIVNTSHTGTLRIATIRMNPLSLFESGESNGQISLKDLFDNPNKEISCHSSMSFLDIINSICIGGWPKSLSIPSNELKLLVAKELYKQTYSVDIANINNKAKNSNIARAIMQSYARNICTTADTTTIFQDVQANYDISKSTFYEYIRALEDLCIIEDLNAWCPAIRSKSSIRSGKKRNFVDPSIAVAALGLSPDYFKNDFKTLGFLFESLCIRDLKIYSQTSNGTISYYRDRYDLEVDCVLHLEDGRYALIEFKLGDFEIDKAAKHLCMVESLINEHNSKEKGGKIRLPDLKIIITGTSYGYRREDGVLVIPIGCLKD